MNPSIGEEFERSARDSISMNPDIYRTLIENVSGTYKKIVLIEKETGSMREKVDKMYLHMMVDPESGSPGMLQTVSENTKNIDKLFQICKMDEERRKNQNFPNKIRLIEDDVEALKRDQELKEAVKETQDEEEAKQKVKDEKRNKLFTWAVGIIIAGLYKVIDMVFKFLL